MLLLDYVWAKVEGVRVTVGLKRAFVAANPIGFVELRPVGSEVQAPSEGEDGIPFGLAVRVVGREFELDSPVSGRVVAINECVNCVDNPVVLKTDPEGDGWLAIIEISSL